MVKFTEMVLIGRHPLKVYNICNVFFFLYISESLKLSDIEGMVTVSQKRKPRLRGSSDLPDVAQQERLSKAGVLTPTLPSDFIKK